MIGYAYVQRFATELPSIRRRPAACVELILLVVQSICAETTKYNYRNNSIHAHLAAFVQYAKRTGNEAKRVILEHAGEQLRRSCTL